MATRAAVKDGVKEQIVEHLLWSGHASKQEKRNRGGNKARNVPKALRAAYQLKQRNGSYDHRRPKIDSIEKRCAPEQASQEHARIRIGISQKQKRAENACHTAKPRIGGELRKKQNPAGERGATSSESRGPT